MLDRKPAGVVKYGIIGCGAITKRYIDVFENLKIACVAAVADSDGAKSKAMAQCFNCLAYDDYHELLTNRDIDVVIIATPSGLHAQMALDSLGAGKHTVVEKPMAMTPEQAGAMINAARRAGRILTTVLNNRFLPASTFLKNTVDQGIMGRMLFGSACVHWYRPQRYYNEAAWRGTKLMDGGVLLNQAIHHLDLLLYYLGDVKQLQAYRATLAHDIEVEDTAVAIVEFTSGAIGTINATTCAYPRNLEETVTVIGEKGSVILGGPKLNGFRAWRVDGVSEPEVKEVPKWYGHYKVIEDVTLAIMEKREPLIKCEDGKKALDLIWSIMSNSKIKLNHNP
ncbi:Gfo/Idh/MocA family protein [Desulfallas thermosapovorans]|uniref:Putative dehydrogenase n=1 Tax=Desulfallas thermosapovorans DSM 6562 TaxID=1121431 RepID=A0A5S4ZUQ8_9FIRM|nr:Gfo/Idh/MocA family oxidoreductase [Desulfallas thermosapovorans]TYO96445.1 putative dehydrogenase [Desulfallas thermosapovorans DSM 6562]